MEAKQDGEVAKTYNARLRARLAEFKDAEGLKLGALARQIGTNEAAVSRYLDGHPLGDVAKLEARVLDFLEAFARRRSWDELCFDTEAVAMCEGAFDLIRESGDIGLVHGPAGIGKSTTCRRYARTHSTAIFFTVMQGAGQDYNIVRAICAALPAPRSAEDKRLKRAVADRLQAVARRRDEDRRPVAGCSGGRDGGGDVAGGRCGAADSGARRGAVEGLSADA